MGNFDSVGAYNSQETLRVKIEHVQIVHPHEHILVSATQFRSHMPFDLPEEGRIVVDNLAGGKTRVIIA